MIFRTITITLVLLLLITCKRDQQQTGICEIIKIDPDNRQLISRSEIFSLNRIIQLEDHPESVIGQTMWMDLLPEEDFILVVGEDIGLYDKNGNFLNNIGKRGRGPGEYMSRSMVLFCDERFRLLDNSQSKVIDYDIDGNFIDEYYLSRQGQSIVCWNDYNIIFHRYKTGEYDNLLFLYDYDFNLIDSFFSIDDVYHYMMVMGGDNFFMYRDSVRLFDSFDYTVYNVGVSNNSFEIKPRYYFDFGRHEIPQAFYDKNFNDIREYRIALQKTDYAHNILGFFENDHNVFFAFQHKESFYMAIYCKHKKETMVIDNIYDDIIFKGQRFSSAIGEFLSYKYFNDKVYFVMDAYRFIDKMDELKESLSDDEWEDYIIDNTEIMKLYNEVNEYDNPLIFVFDLKPVM